jgi:flagellar biosynthesis protein FlhB
MAADNRTEKPTARRLAKAREKGQIARSREVPSAFVLVGGLMVLSFWGERMVGVLMAEMRRTLSLNVPPELTVNYTGDLLRDVAVRVGVAVVPLGLVCFAVSVAANVVQGGLVFAPEALTFKFDKLNPANGAKRLFSKNGAVELAKGLALVAVVGVMTWQVISKYLPIYPRLVMMDTRQLLHWTSTISFDLFVRVGIFLLIIAIGDYAFQRYRFHDSLKMSKQEVKEEYKDLEGDPQIKGRIRRLQREMARRRMMADVSKADVVITNPTHFAVALSYEVERMEAPKVVAKGAGFLALKIKELARKHDVPMVENKPLAQTLYKTVEVGDTIPVSLYKAVAEILAYIYRARNAWRR